MESTQSDTFVVEWDSGEGQWAGRCIEKPNLVTLSPSPSDALWGIHEFVIWWEEWLEEETENEGT
jgi:hypothetical protein